MIVVVLDLPPKELNPNSRAFWRVKRLAVKAYREHAKTESMVAAYRYSLYDPFREVKIQASFYRRRNVPMDGDNALAMLKPAFDGLQDAGIIANDRQITHLPVLFFKDAESPRVELRIEAQT